MLKAVYRRVHAVRVAICQQSKAREAATKKRAALCFHSAVRLFVYTFGRFAKGVLYQGSDSTSLRSTRAHYSFANDKPAPIGKRHYVGLAQVDFPGH
jgi:hypothetical protein